jgi:MGT family glycosyltransferase
MTKPNILFGTVGWNIAETTRMIEIAKASQAHFTPHFASYGGQFEHLITEAGFDLHPLTPTETPEKIDYLWRVDRLETFGHPYTVDELRQRVRSELTLMETLAPHAIVMGSVLTMPISARVAKIPLVNVVPLAMTRPYLQAGLPIAPDLPKPIARIMNWVGLHVPLMTQNFSKVAREHGLPRFRNLVSVWEGDFNLATEIPMLAGIDTLPDNWRFIGPIFAHLDSAVPANVQSLADDKSKPFIYFAMGSSANRDVILQVAQGFASIDAHIVAPIRAHVAGAEAQLPANIHVTDWLPAPEVNAMADIAVIHGGQGTVQTACASGTPFLGIGMQPEQSINIDVVVRYGSAHRLSRSKATPERVNQAIRALLNDDNAHQKAKALQTEFARWQGAQNAADFLLEHFSQRMQPEAIPYTPYTAQAIS